MNTDAPVLSAEAVKAGYGRGDVLNGVDFACHAGEIVGVVGANGCGKSTLLRVLSGALRPRTGVARLEDRPIHAWRAKPRARRLALMPQTADVPPGLTVRELVSFGRHPHRGRSPASEHEAVMDRVIAACDLQSLEDRSVAALSGGERQRARLAMALAQEPRVFMLDEPTSSLDVGHQIDVMALLATQHAASDLAVVIVMHDLNVAARWCQRLVVMHEGRVIADAPPSEALSEETLHRAFGVHCTRGRCGSEEVMLFERPQTESDS